MVFYNAGNTQEKELCDQAGIPAVAISATKWDYDVIKTYDEWIALLSQIFPEQDKAQVVSDYSKEIYDMIQERVASLDDSERTRVLFLFQYSDSAMITSGRHFFGQYWASAAGGINVAQDLEADNSNATISMEQVYEWNPDVIYITNFTPPSPRTSTITPSAATTGAPSRRFRTAACTSSRWAAIAPIPPAPTRP